MATIVVVARRWRGASPSRRLAIAPVLVTGAIAFALLIPWMLNDALDEPLGDWPDVALQLALAAVPVAFLVGLLRTRLARAAVADLVVELGGQVAPGALRAALARALRDPSLTVAYWLADAGATSTPTGRTVDAPGRPERAVTEVEREGRRIAALVHDPALADEPELVALRRRRGRARARERAPAGRAARPARGAARLARADRRGRRRPSGGGSSATCTTARSSGSCRSR